MAIGIGTRVQVTHNPGDDDLRGGRGLVAARLRKALNGHVGVVESLFTEDLRPEAYVRAEGVADAAWFYIERELTEVVSDPDPVAALRDELANEKAAHAEAERLLSAERAALEVSRAKVLDLEMRAVEAERLLSEARRQIADAHAAFDKAGALTHMIGNESRGIDEQRATLAERAEDIQQARIEAERRENEARVDAEIARAESLKTRQDAQEARDRLSRVKAAVDALRAAWKDGMIDGVDQALAAVDRALAGVEGPNKTAPDREALGREVRRVWIAWAREQASPKPSWLVPWEGLSEPDREVDRRIGERLWTMGAGVEARPVLTEDRAREMAEEAIEASMNRSTVVLRDNMAALLLRVSRGDFGETASRASDAADDAVMTVAEQDAERARVGEALTVPADIGGRTVATRVEAPPGKRWAYDEQCEEWCLVSTEPAVEQPRTDLAALADAIEANGRTWQRVEPSTLAKALRAVDRRMRTLEAAVTALAASVEHVQATAGIGEARVVDCEGGVNGPMRVRRPDPQDDGEAGDDCPPSCTNPDPNHRHPALRAKRLADKQRTRLHEGDPTAANPSGVWHFRRADMTIVCPEQGPNEGATSIREHVNCARCLVTMNEPASPQQGDVVPGLVLGHIDGQPIRARYTGVTPTEPRKP